MTPRDQEAVILAPVVQIQLSFLRCHSSPCHPGLRFAAPTQADASTESVSSSPARVGRLDSVDKRETPGVRKWEESQNSGSESKPVPRDRYQHCTFCSSCEIFRTDLHAVAKCEACPRILCRKCASQKGEEVPCVRNAEDTAFPADKCLCQSKDSEFPKPRKGKDPKAHLLKHLRRHDLSLMFREPVDVEDNPGYLDVVLREQMMDLGTLMIRTVKHKKYQSSRGQKLFRDDIKKIWINCWSYAGYGDHSTGEVAGIVRCTIILEVMVQKYYTSCMEEEQELVGDKESWQAASDRRKKEEFARCARFSGGFSGEEVPFAPEEFKDGVDEETDVEDESSRIGAAVGHKRKFIEDDDDFLSDAETVVELATRSSEDCLDRNMCALAAIGESFHPSGMKSN